MKKPSRDILELIKDPNPYVARTALRVARERFPKQDIIPNVDHIPFSNWTEVAQAYVVGAPDRQTGEAIHAFVVPTGDEVPDRDRLVALVRARLSANSVPKTVTTIRHVPVNAAGKPDKPALLIRTGAGPDA